MAAGSDLALLSPRPLGRSAVPRSIRRAASATFLMLADVAVALLVMLIVTRLARIAPDDQPRYLAAALTPIPLFATLGLYAEWGLGPVERVRARAYGIVVATILIAPLALWQGDPSLGILLAIVLAAAAAFTIGYYLAEELRRFLMTRLRWGAPAVLIGTGPESMRLAHDLSRRPELGLRLVCLVREPATSSPSPTSSYMNLPILGDIGDAGLFSEIEVAIAIEGEGLPTSLLLRLPFRHVVVCRGLQGGPLACPRFCVLGGAIGLKLRRDIYRRSNLAIKRAFDILLTAPLLLVAGPLILGLAAFIKLSSPGPAFFRQARTGRDGAVFEMLKLRTMHLDAAHKLEEHLAGDADAREEWSRFYKLRHDPRVIPGIGSFIRRTSLDELPQLLNVMLGQMSLVGPRPFPDYHLAAFDTEFNALRSSVPPGLTGYWQVCERSDGDLAVQQEQDSYYIQNWSVWLDVYVVLRTPVAILTGTGAR